MDDDRTLDDLDPPAWGPADYPSYLVRRTHELRMEPIGAFTAEDLRIMISQQIGLHHLLPRALTVLEADPLIEGDFFPGDLLEAVMRIEPAYWDAHRDECARLMALTETLVPLDSEVLAAIKRFRSEHA